MKKAVYIVDDKRVVARPVTLIAYVVPNPDQEEVYAKNVVGWHGETLRVIPEHPEYVDDEEHGEFVFPTVDGNVHFRVPHGPEDFELVVGAFPGADLPDAWESDEQMQRTFFTMCCGEAGD